MGNSISHDIFLKEEDSLKHHSFFYFLVLKNMKKALILINILFVLLLASCTNSEPTTIPNKDVENENGQSIFETTTGQYSYYLQADDSFSSYKESVLNRICFEPAQFEIAKYGSIFCFNNTQEALKLFRFEEIDIDNSCKYYWGIATIKIKNLTDKKDVPTLKSDPCVETGTCTFNEAELIEVVDDESIPNNKALPECEK